MSASPSGVALCFRIPLDSSSELISSSDMLTTLTRCRERERGRERKREREERKREKEREGGREKAVHYYILLHAE